MGKRERKRHARRRHAEQKQHALAVEAKRSLPVAADLLAPATADEGVVTAIVAVTGNIDHDHDRIVPGAFRFPGKTAVLTEHQWDSKSMLGRVMGVEEWQPGDPRLPDDLKAAGYGALVATMQLNLDKQTARDVWSDLKMDPAAWGWSIGYTAVDSEQDGKVRLLKAVDVHEFSVVPFIGSAWGPSNAATRTLTVKSDEPPENEEGKAMPSMEETMAEMSDMVDGIRTLMDRLMGADSDDDEESDGKSADPVEDSTENKADSEPEPDLDPVEVDDATDEDTEVSDDIATAQDATPTQQSAAQVTLEIVPRTESDLAAELDDFARAVPESASA